MNSVKEFFDSVAGNWDKREKKSYSELDSFIRKYVPISEGMKALDLACGTGVITNILYNITKREIDAVDISSEMIKCAISKNNNPDIHFRCDDFMNIKNIYDIIVCFNAFPHFIDVEAFRNKAYELLNENGYLVIIHNLSRKQLDSHHSFLSSDISRSLKPINEESLVFKGFFNTEEIIDNDEMILLSLRKAC